MARNPEQCLISAVVRTGGYQEAVREGVEPDWFGVHDEEWDWVAHYFRRNHRPPSVVAFRTKFPDFTLLKVDDLQHYVNELRTHTVRTRLIESMREASDDLKAGDVGRAIQRVHSDAIQYNRMLGTRGYDDDILDNFDQVAAEIETRKERFDKYGMAGIPTGFTTLDDRTGGPQPGHVWVVGARLGQGKSWTLIRMGATAAMQGKSVLYNALEMTRPEVATRLHSFLARGSGKKVWDSQQVLQGRLTDMDDYRTFLRELRGTVGGKFHVIGTDSARTRLTPSILASQIETLKPDLVIVDYLTLMRGGDGKEDWVNVAHLINELKAMAGTYQVPIVVASQLNREHGLNKTDEPAGPESLSRSDAVGQDADAVINMKQVSHSVIAMKLVKYRHGPSGYRWWIDFRPSEGVMDEVSQERAFDLRDKDATKEKE